MSTRKWLPAGTKIRLRGFVDNHYLSPGRIGTLFPPRPDEVEYCNRVVSETHYDTRVDFGRDGIWWVEAGNWEVVGAVHNWPPKESSRRYNELKTEVIS
jgi:hypothetical protein